MAAESPRIFYRVVETDSPTTRDFMSNEALGRQPKRPLSDRDRDRWRGVSHFDSQELAKFAAGRSPWLGKFIATVAIPPGVPIRREQTYRSAHWTLWGEPADLLALVVSVVPV
jgi:hypothetical protein